ncbi:MAG: hypothetical protein WC989_00945 [Micavibrio sp.]
MKNRLKLAALAALALPSLAACSGTAREEVPVYYAQESAAPVDPSDGALHAAIQHYLESRGGPKNSQYQYTRMDLNGDGLREGLVLFNLPHSYWCGWSGCTLAVFGAGDDNFMLVSETSRIRGPLFIGGSATNGWEDIAVRLTGTDHPDRNIVLRFDGQSYPENPLNAAPVPFDLAALGGTRVFP